MILTKAGEIFLEHATQILDDVKRAENKMHHLATDGGHIDIADVSLWQESIFRALSGIFSHLSKTRISPSISIRISHP